MKGITIVVICLILGACGLHIRSCVSNNLTYEREFSSHWEMADRSSTIAEKSVRLSKFVAALEGGDFAKHSAIFLQTPQNSFAENMAALKTLSERLKQIEGMDPGSPQYALSIDQITKQEQGEAGAMLSVFLGAWFIEHCIWNFDWIAILFFGFYTFALITACASLGHQIENG